MNAPGWFGSILLALCIGGPVAGAGPQSGAGLRTSAVDPTAEMFNPTRVLEIEIQIDADAWNQLCAQKRTFVSLFRGACLAQPFPNPFTWFSARVTIDGQTRENVGVRKKGFLGSLDAIKPALKIDLSRFQTNAAIYDVKRLTLNNAKQDPSLIRQCLGYQLFAQAGLPASRCNFAHVTVNGEDQGIYVNVEDIRKPMLARHFTDNSGNLYEGTVSDFHPALRNTFELQSNEDTNDGSDLDAVIATLASNHQDPVTALGALVDLDSFVRFWAMEALVGHWDGYSSNRNNYYLYHDPVAGKFHFMPWGIDTILSDGYPIASLDPGANRGMFAYSAITRRLVDIPEMRARYLAQMQQLLSTVWNESTILGEIDRMENLLAPYAGDLANTTTSVRDFVTGQRALIMQALGNDPPVFSPLTILDLCLVENGAVSGAFAATWGTAGSALPFQAGAASIRGSIAGVALQTTSGGADAGLAIDRPNPREGILNMYFQLSGGATAAMTATVDSTLLRPGASLSIDGQQVDAAVWFQGGALAGLLDQGTMKLHFASTHPGGAVCGSFEANSYTFSFALLSGALSNDLRPENPRIPITSSTLLGGLGIGEVMRQCRPGKSPH